MPRSAASVATLAASAAVAGSNTRRTVSSVSTNSVCGLVWITQYSTSGSSRCHSLRGRTTAPARCFDSTSPLATNTRTASRSTGRLTSYSASSTASDGNRSPGANSPATMRMPSVRTMRACMLLRSGGWR
jgi:hypothetical protein